MNECHQKGTISKGKDRLPSSNFQVQLVSFRGVQPPFSIHKRGRRYYAVIFSAWGGYRTLCQLGSWLKNSFLTWLLQQPFFGGVVTRKRD